MSVWPNLDGEQYTGQKHAIQNLIVKLLSSFFLQKCDCCAWCLHVALMTSICPLPYVPFLSVH